VPLLFIYGTLRRGEANHAHLAGARFAGAARTAARFTLVDLGEFPALVTGGADAVAGELWEVDADHLVRLDEFEEHPDVYRRETIALDDGREVFAYLLPDGREQGTRIPSGDWKKKS
jgi:gamma-glutamylaminecyclotransferase